MENLTLAKQLADRELEKISGGRQLTPREDADLEKADQRAIEVVDLLERTNNRDALRKFRDDYTEASYRYTRSVLNDKIAPDSVMFSEFFETYYGWPS